MNNTQSHGHPRDADRDSARSDDRVSAWSKSQPNGVIDARVHGSNRAKEQVSKKGTAKRAPKIGRDYLQLEHLGLRKVQGKGVQLRP